MQPIRMAATHYTLLLSRKTSKLSDFWCYSVDTSLTLLNTTELPRSESQLIKATSASSKSCTLRVPNLTTCIQMESRRCISL